MAVPENGYVDDAVAYAYARARFPNNFTGTVPTDSFRSNLVLAGDIINSNDNVFVGEKVAGLSGDRVWPRMADDTSAIATYPFLDGVTLPEQLIRGYEWLTIMVALSPEQFGTTSDSSTEVVTNAGGVTGIGYDGVRVDYAQQGTDTRKRNVTSVHSITYQFHYQQALNYLNQLLRPGAELSVPGVDQELPTGVAGQQVFADMAQFEAVRA